MTEPRVGRLDAGDDVQKRRLAGAVRADDADDPALGSALTLTPRSARNPPKETLISLAINIVDLPGFRDQPLLAIEEDEDEREAVDGEAKIGDEVRRQAGPLRDEAGRDAEELHQRGADAPRRDLSPVRR